MKARKLKLVKKVGAVVVCSHNVPVNSCPWGKCCLDCNAPFPERRGFRAVRKIIKHRS